MPARLNGVNINDISIQRTSIPYEGLDFSNSSVYTARYLTYTAIYTVYSCAVGIPLLSHTATNSDLITVQRAIPATSGVTGEFTVSAPQHYSKGFQTMQNFAYNAPAIELERWLESTFKDDLAITMSRTCFSTTYNIRWLSKVLDYEPLIVDGSGLIQEVGNVTFITVRTVTDGGVFLRPFRGDMLRLPKSNPQVNL